MAGFSAIEGYERSKAAELTLVKTSVSCPGVASGLPRRRVEYPQRPSWRRSAVIGRIYTEPQLLLIVTTMSRKGKVP